MSVLDRLILNDSRWGRDKQKGAEDQALGRSRGGLSTQDPWGRCEVAALSA